MRVMSFSATEKQITERTKTVTRRTGWDELKPGTRLRAVNKAMGLKRGEKAKTLAFIEVVSVQQVALADITQEDCIKEGFPELDPQGFIDLFTKINKGPGKPFPYTVNRIEFRYLTDAELNEVHILPEAKAVKE